MPAGPQPIPLSQSVYERADNPFMRLKNMLFETAPTNLRDQVSLLMRPGLRTYADFPSYPVRGIYQAGGNAGTFSTFVVSGGNLYLTFGPGAFSVGIIAGSDPVSMAAGLSSIGIVGGGVIHKYVLGGAVTTVASPAAGLPMTIDYLAGYFLLGIDGSGRVYFSAVDDLTFDVLDFFNAQSSPDFVIQLRVLGEELWLLGSNTVEIWAATGDPDAPFQRLPGRTSSIGCVSKECVAKVSDSLVWVGRDRVVYRSGGVPSPISTPAITEYLLAHNTEALKAFAYEYEGRAVYVLQIGQLRTLACDLSTGKWFDLTSAGSSRWNVNYSDRDFRGTVLIGDGELGRVWALDSSVGADGDDLVEIEFSGIVGGVESTNRCNVVRLDCSVGDATLTYPLDDPQVEICWSDDNGKTFSDWEGEPLGRQGEYADTVAWTRLGDFGTKGRVFRWRATPPPKFTVTGATMNGSVR